VSRPFILVGEADAVARRLTACALVARRSCVIDHAQVKLTRSMPTVHCCGINIRGVRSGKIKKILWVGRGKGIFITVSPTCQSRLGFRRSGDFMETVYYIFQCIIYFCDSLLLFQASHHLLSFPLSFFIFFSPGHCFRVIFFFLSLIIASTQ